MTENPICSWQGIKCDDDTADTGVTEIKLESNSLQYSEKASEYSETAVVLKSQTLTGHGVKCDWGFTRLTQRDYLKSLHCLKC